MKRTLKKASATIIAVVSATAMMASMTPAYASEIQASTNNEFIRSFNEGIDRQCAQYLIDNGCTLDEATNIMSTYLRGSEMLNASRMSRTTSTEHYYNTTALAPTEHYVLVIAVTPNQTASDEIIIDVTGPNASVATTAENLIFSPDFIQNVDYPSSSFKGAGSRWRHTINFEGISAQSSSYATAAARIEIEPISSTINTEASLYNAISMSVNSTEDYVFDYETFARGDVNHDGYVNESDSTLLLQYLVGSVNSLEITYADGSNHYSFATNYAAADFNLDGSVSMSDVTALNQCIASL